MKCYVINLDRSPERWRWMERQADKAGLTIERLAAIDGTSLTERQLSGLTGDSFLNYTLRAGEMACFLSHRACWRLAVENGEPYTAVLEDDVHFGPDLAAFLNADGWIPEDADIVKLETMNEVILHDRRPVRRLRDRSVYRLRGLHTGTAAYVISRKAAARLSAELNKVGDPVDQTLFHPSSPWFARLTTYQVTPALCIQDHVYAARYKSSLIHQSLLKGERILGLKAKPGMPAKLWREFRRPFIQLGSTVQRMLPLTRLVRRRIPFI